AGSVLFHSQFRTFSTENPELVRDLALQKPEVEPALPKVVAQGREFGRVLQRLETGLGSSSANS
ncbi:MAG: hypothetical protein SH850_29945, partial [Planctomycetaceae bacterium]|nr:hypothetical protein [Planctomycetaceae bacterium]